MAIYGNFSSPMFQLQQQIQEMTTFSNLIETTEYRYISESFISTIVGKLRKLFDKFLGFLKDRFENLKAKLKKKQFEFRYIKLRKKLDDPAKDKIRFHETLYYVVPGSDFSFFDQLKPFSFFEECADTEEEDIEEFESNVQENSRKKDEMIDQIKEEARENIFQIETLKMSSSTVSGENGLISVVADSIQTYQNGTEQIRTQLSNKLGSVYIQFSKAIQEDKKAVSKIENQIKEETQETDQMPKLLSFYVRMAQLEISLNTEIYKTLDKIFNEATELVNYFDAHSKIYYQRYLEMAENPTNRNVLVIIQWIQGTNTEIRRVVSNFQNNI